MVTKTGKHGSADSRIRLIILDGVLYAGEHGANDLKPVLPEVMVQHEIYRSHRETGCGGQQVTCEHVRRKFHHYKATSTRALEEMAKLTVPCFLCITRHKITLKRGLLPYADMSSLLMGLGGYQCSTWSHDILYMIHDDPREIPFKYGSF